MVFFFGYPASSFWGFFTQACFAFLLRFTHSFDSFAFILLLFSSTRVSFTLAGGSRWCFFFGYPASSFWGFLHRLASLSCFALHTPLTLLLSFFFFFQARGHPLPWQVVAGGVFFGVPCLLFLGLLTQACFAFLLRFTHSFDSFAFILLLFSSTRASFTLAGGSRWCFFFGYPASSFWGLLTQACFAFLLRFAHSFDSFAFILPFFQARGHPSPWQVVAGGVFFWVPCLLFLGPSYAGLLRFLASLCTLL